MKAHRNRILAIGCFVGLIAVALFLVLRSVQPGKADRGDGANPGPGPASAQDLQGRSGAVGGAKSPSRGKQPDRISRAETEGALRGLILDSVNISYEDPVALLDQLEAYAEGTGIEFLLDRNILVNGLKPGKLSLKDVPFEVALEFIAKHLDGYVHIGEGFVEVRLGSEEADEARIAQQEELRQRVGEVQIPAVSFEKVSLSEALETLRARSAPGFKIGFEVGPEFDAHRRNITYRASNEPLSDVLTEVAKQANLRVVFSNDGVVLTDRNPR